MVTQTLGTLCTIPMEDTKTATNRTETVPLTRETTATTTF